MRPRSSTITFCVSASAISTCCSTSTKALARSAVMLPERRRQLFDHNWRKTFERLVQQQQRRIGHQRARDRQHLLLTAGQLIAQMAAALGERGNRS